MSLAKRTDSSLMMAALIVIFSLVGFRHISMASALETSEPQPSSRSWQLVSPPNKHGALIEPLTSEGGVIQAASLGDAITYVASAPVSQEPAGNRAPEFAQVLQSVGVDLFRSRALILTFGTERGTPFVNNDQFFNLVCRFY